MWKYKLPILFLILMSFTALAAPAKFGINFYDEANFLAPDKQHRFEHMEALPQLANHHFKILRTITDFNEGDPSQRICSCYHIGAVFVNKRQCAFQQGVNKTKNLKLVLTIENPDKWLATKAKAINYLYQFVLPLQQGVSFPTRSDLQPNFWGIKPNSMQAAGCVINPKTNHILAIVVGLEVGTHLNPAASNFTHKAKQVTQLNNYIHNLIAALNDFGLKETIYVTTSIAPSNCDEASGKCGNILEFINLKNNYYYLNKSKTVVNGQAVDFANTYAALKTIKSQQYSGNPLGVLLSLYHYWQYFPGENLSGFDIKKWEIELDHYHEKLQKSIHQEPDLADLPVSVGEIGWPTTGDPRYDGAPNEPGLTTHSRVLQAIYNWGKNDTDKVAPIILLWRMFEIDNDAALLMNGVSANPEFSYGIFGDGLENLYTQSLLLPRVAENFPDFKSFKTGEILIETPNNPETETTDEIKTPVETANIPATETNTGTNQETNNTAVQANTNTKITADFYCPLISPAETHSIFSLDKDKQLIKHDWHYFLFSTGNHCNSGKNIACIEKNAEHRANQYKLYCNYAHTQYQIGYLWYASTDCKVVGNDGFKGCQYIP